MSRTRTLRAYAAIALAACLPPVAGAFAGEPPTAAEPPTMAAISSKMTGVAGELARRTTGEPVQVQQKVILRDLDDLIAELEKQCSACRNGIAANRPRRPAPDSNIHGGTGGIGDLVEPGRGEKDWARLSSRERDRILQSMSEGFPPEYRTVLERYYRRLAEEKTTTAGAAAAKTDAGADTTPAPASGPAKP